MSRRPVFILILMLASPLAADAPAIVKVNPAAPLDARTLFSKPDATVLLGPNGERTTVGELKRLHKDALVRKVAATPVSAGEEPLPELTHTTAQRLREDFVAASAAAQAALARLKINLVAALTPEQKLAQAAHKIIQGMPCDRVLFNVEGVAYNFVLQPGLPIVLKGCFKNTPAPEVRIVGNFPPLGFLLLNVDDRGDDYIHGTVPQVSGVPDQPITVFIRFNDGVKTNERPGFFSAARTTFDVTDPYKIAQLLTPQCDGPPVQFKTISADTGLTNTRNDPSSRLSGHDTWVIRSAAQGFQVTKFWRKRIFGPIEFYWNGAFPQMNWECDRLVDTTCVWIVCVTGDPYYRSAYGITRLRIEGPVGLQP